MKHYKSDSGSIYSFTDEEIEMIKLAIDVYIDSLYYDGLASRELDMLEDIKEGFYT